MTKPRAPAFQVGTSDVHASSDLPGGLPKDEFPTAERNPRGVFAAARDGLTPDGDPRRSLTAFCRTGADDGIRDPTTTA